MPRITAACAGAVAVLIALAGCAKPLVTTTEEPISSVSSTKGVSAPTPEVLELTAGYVGAVISQDPAVVRETLKDTAPGSPAAAYLTHLAHVDDARVAGSPGEVTEGDLTRSATGFESCYAVGNTCNSYDDFVVRSGKVADLKVNGQPVGPRLTAGKARKVTTHGITFEFLTAYASAETGALSVTVKVRTKRDITVGTEAAVYAGPNGRQRGPHQVLGPTVLGAKSNATLAFSFKGMAPGGTLVLSGCRDQACAHTYTARLRITR